ncbi:MAG TPA: acyltransferase family protein, partial [Solirubrobacterales bacterium]
VVQADSRRGDGFRPDLEGLRGVAILLVLLFHAGVPWAQGGYVGVDVFFVLSGFLITGLLLRERERTGSISLTAFYARRARRILPAAAVVLVATLLVALPLLDPLALERLAADAAAAAVSAANIRFAASALDYFAAQGQPSPVLHYWSLGVEEQFYLVWPTLLLLATRLARPRRGAAIALGAVLVLSFAASLYLTSASAPWAFYSLPTRAWQLALGGLLAIGAAGLARLPGRALALLGWLSLGAIVAALLVLDPATPYPGTAALLPSLGAAGVIAAGDVGLGPGRLLVAGPLRYLGRISYSLYLVHWPVLVLPAAGLAIGAELPATERAALVGLSIVLGALSYRFVEQPFLHGRRLVFPARRTLALGGAAIAVTVLVAAGVDAGASRELDSYGGVAGASAGPNVASASGGPQIRGVPATPAPGPQPLPRDVQPPLRQAAKDLDLLEQNGCAVDTPIVQPSNCVYGNVNGTTTIALVGDSHAAQWFPAVQRIALANGWKLLPFTKLSCRFVDMRIYSRVLKREYTECETWRQLVVKRLRAAHPALTIVSAASDMATMTPADNDPERQAEATARILSQVPGKIAIISDTPLSQFDIVSCLSGHLADVRACETPRSYAFANHGIVERRAAQLMGATLIDLSSQICPGDPCPVVLNNELVYRDYLHLTATFVASLTPAVAAALPDIAGAPPPPLASRPTIGAHGIRADIPLTSPS